MIADNDEQVSDVETPAADASSVAEAVVDEEPPEVSDASNASAPDLTAAHGFLSELETRLALLQSGSIRFDERQVAWLSAKTADIRQSL
jgi:hypothetical protein